MDYINFKSCCQKDFYDCISNYRKKKKKEGNTIWKLLHPQN